VIDKADRVDISFNAVGIPNTKILNVPLVELDAEQFSLPITSYTRTYFLTARIAARRASHWWEATVRRWRQGGTRPNSIR
jgi:hypothetical protein